MQPLLNQPPNAILFDLDGTLLDTAKDLGNALNHILVKHKYPTVEYTSYRNIASDGAKGMLELGFGKNLEQFNINNLRQQFLDLYQRNICVDTCYFEGIDTVLMTLNERNIPWGIVTNKPEFLTLLLVEYFPLLANCQVIISGDTLRERKPHPLPLLHAQQKFNLSTTNTWYIGDALRDIQAANNANMTSVIAEYGYIDKETNLDTWNANLSIQQPIDLIDYL